VDRFFVILFVVNAQLVTHDCPGDTK